MTVRFAGHRVRGAGVAPDRALAPDRGGGRAMGPPAQAAVRAVSSAGRGGRDDAARVPHVANAGGLALPEGD